MKPIPLTSLFLASAAMLAAMLGVQIKSSADSPFPNGTYVLSPAAVPYLALEAIAAGKTPGTGIDIGLKMKSDERIWTLADTGDGQYLLTPLHAPTLALTLKNGATDNGSPLDLEPIKKDPTQLWSFKKISDGVYGIAPRCGQGGVGIDDFGGGASPGSTIDIWEFNTDDPHLQWSITPASTISMKPILADGTYTITPHDGKTLNMAADGASSSPGTAVIGDTASDVPSQKWIIAQTGDGFVTISPSHAKSLVMTVQDSGAANQTPLILQPLKAGAANQKWCVIPAPNTPGEYVFLPAHAFQTGIDNPGGAKDPGAHLQIWSLDMNNTHMWWLVKPVK